MIALKAYQTRVLDSLTQFFRHCSKTRSPEESFQLVQAENGQTAVPYISVNKIGLTSGMPYVCLRVPTGGGKTLLACYASGSAMTNLLHAERTVVLWLVPSNTILNQTADALRDVRHPYRQALELSCGSVEVVTIEEALCIPRAIVEGQTVVIVSTIQAFRVEDTTGRKVYDQNGAFSEHLQNLPIDRIQDMLPGADGKPKPSLVNMLRLRRPIVIVDEAHNARTDLSFSTLGNILPSCIIEFTATPDRTKHPSNVLHRVSAAELKAASMVKLPLRVIVRDPSQRDQLLADAIALRSDLEKLAITESQQTGEYIRPIMLIQAERVDGCEPLREKMASDYGIQKEQIKISTGKLDELKGIENISLQKCPVRFIITVEKLREGWDCPFAYVLCSLKETRSATAIEQIVGRILRLPQAHAKEHQDLNCSYAFSVSPNINDVLVELREALESNGFTKAEAERIIIPVSQRVLPLGVQPLTEIFNPSEIDSDVADAQNLELNGKAVIDAASGKITVYVPLAEKDIENIADCIKDPEQRFRIKVLADKVKEAELAFGGAGKFRIPSPFEKQIDFKVPLLCVEEDGELFEFESTFLLEHPWYLSQKDASLSDAYDPLTPPYAKTGEVDIGGRGEVLTTLFENTPKDFVTSLHQQVLSLGTTADWSLERLVGWLDRHIDHHDIPSGESAEFLRKVVRGLMAKFGIADIETLARDRFRLRDEIEDRIQQHRESERKTAFQTFLFPESPLCVSDQRTINFRNIVYEPSRLYDGGYQFQKHYFGPKPGELEETAPSGRQKEEFRCAQFIDNLPEIKFWVRNLVKKDSSFRLQTSRDWFYPDFICELHDGRILVVEYKGGHLMTGADAEEKRAVGAVWESRSKGKCLFVMPTEGEFEGFRKIIKNVLPK